MPALIPLHDPALVDCLVDFLLLVSLFLVCCSLGAVLCFLFMDRHASGAVQEAAQDAELEALLQEAWDSVSCADEPDLVRVPEQSAPVSCLVPQGCEMLWGASHAPVLSDLWGDLIDQFVDVHGFLSYVFAWDLMPLQISEVCNLLRAKKPRICPRAHLVDAQRFGSGLAFRGVLFDHMADLVGAVAKHVGFAAVPEHATQRGATLELDLRAFMQPVLPAHMTTNERQYRRTLKALADPQASEKYYAAKRERDRIYNAKRCAVKRE